MKPASGNRGKAPLAFVVAGTGLLLVAIVMVVLEPTLLGGGDLTISLLRAKNSSLGLWLLFAPPTVGLVILLCSSWMANAAAMALARVAESSVIISREWGPAVTPSTWRNPAEVQDSKPSPTSLYSSWTRFARGAVRGTGAQDMRWRASETAADVLRDVDPCSDMPMDPVRSLRWSAGLAVSVGMLGTFLGVSEGLGRFQGGAKDAEIVVVGLASAFWTSIVGLISGLLLSLAAAALERVLDHAIASVATAWEEALPHLSAREVWLSMFGVQTLADTGESMDFRSELTGTLIQQLEAMQELRDTVNELGHMVADRVGKVEDALGGLGQTISAPIADAARAGTAAAQELVDRTLAPLSESIGQFAGVFDEFQSEVKQLSGTVRQTVQESQVVALASSQALGTASERFREVTSSLEAFEAVATTLGETQGELDASIAAFEERATRLMEHQTALLEETHQAAGVVSEATVAMASSAERVHAALRQMDLSLGSTVSQLVEAQRGLSDAAAAMTAAAAEAGALAEVQGALLGQSAELLKAAATVAGEVAAASSDVGQAVGVLEQALPHLAEAANALEESSSALSSMPDAGTRLAEAAARAASALEQQQEAMAHWSKELLATTDGQLRVYDQHLSTALDGLARANNGLHEMAEEVTDAVERLREAMANAREVG